jgi:adenylylsulfate kinase-like enzyme
MKDVRDSLETGLGKQDEERTTLLNYTMTRKAAANHPDLIKLSHLVSSFHRERRTFRHAFCLATDGERASKAA